MLAKTAYVSIVFTRYMLLSVEKRIDEDDRTAGEHGTTARITIDDIQGMGGTQ